MDLGLRDRVALVAASSKGLGRAIAVELAREGAKVAISARGEAELNSARDAIAAETGAQVVAIPADVTDLGAISMLVQTTRRALGPIGVLVTNAGGPPPGPFETHDADAWDRATKLTLRSVVELCRAVLSDMNAAGWGRILNVTSIAAKEPVDNLMLSNSLRAAVTGFARTLANEVAKDGITVNNLMPGYTRTDRLEQLAGAIAQREGISKAEAFGRWEARIPMGRLGEPAELAALAAFLASDRASYITGTSIAVDGGCIRALI